MLGGPDGYDNSGVVALGLTTISLYSKGGTINPSIVSFLSSRLKSDFFQIFLENDTSPALYFSLCSSTSFLLL